MASGIDRQGEVDPGPLPLSAVDPDGAAMRFNNRFADRQPQSQSAYGRITGVGPVKFIEGLTGLFRGHADPLIRNRNDQFIFAHLPTDADGFPGRRVLFLRAFLE